MFLIKNGIDAISILYTVSHKKILNLMGKCLNCILTYLYCINYNEINICISKEYKIFSTAVLLKVLKDKKVQRVRKLR